MRRALILCLLVFSGPAPVVLAQGAPIPVSRIAFGSCAQQDRPQPIWKAIVDANPQVFLFIGDNIYGDTEDMRVLRAKYAKLAAQKGFQLLRKQCPILATWDDHDYGVNDGGAEYPKREESQRIFLEFFGVPKSDPRWKRPGVYSARIYGPPDKRLQIILLDTRYFRSPLKRRPARAPGSGPYVPDPSPKKTLLGEAQWKWLEEQLRKPAELRIIASSIQVVPEDHGWEKWMNFPHERERLFRLIRETGAEGVLFISGDRHLAELSQMDGRVGYPLYDLTSSGLNQGAKRWRPLEVNRHRVATMAYGNNFGFIEVDWKRKDPLIRLQIRDEVGDIFLQQKLPLSVLKRGTLPLTSARARLLDGKELTPELVVKYKGSPVTLRMKVRNTGKSSANGWVFLNSASNRFSDENFTVVVKPGALDDLKRDGVADPVRHFLYKTIEVHGTLATYRGRPEIIVERASQIVLR